VHIDAVLLEFDGIVADTFGARRTAVERALVEHGVTLADEEYWELCAGWPTSEAVRAVARQWKLQLDDTALDLLAFRVDRVYSAEVGKGVLLAEGARAALERLAGGARLAVVSRLRRTDIEALVALARLEHLFSFVIGEEDAYPPKPDRAPYLAGLRRLERLRGRSEGIVVALENGVAGIRSARGAGLPCIAVGPQPAHVAIEAEAFAQSIAGLDLDVLQALLARRPGTA
jgi:beta-phosphoglucomutase-like phosphatase (HAD superfamily)